MVGYITGMGALHSNDSGLRALYESCASDLPASDEERDSWLARYFETRGYRTE